MISERERPGMDLCLLAGDGNHVQDDDKSESYYCESDFAESVRKRKQVLSAAREEEDFQQRKKRKMSGEKDQLFEIFQPWALKTYGDQAKTKTITLKKKLRILKALEGKEANNPDSSKFRFWVKSKGFTTRLPYGFGDSRFGRVVGETASKDYCDVDLFVASTSKDFGERTYRKVAAVERFFQIIFNVHVELGGRNGRHAGQKRTYRIITETYAFLPREAVTKFLSICPECQKNLRSVSPSSRVDEPVGNDSSSEIESGQFSSHSEPESTQAKKEEIDRDARKIGRNSFEPLYNENFFQYYQFLRKAAEQAISQTDLECSPSDFVDLTLDSPTEEEIMQQSDSLLRDLLKPETRTQITPEPVQDIQPSSAINFSHNSSSFVDNRSPKKEDVAEIDLQTVKPITSTYLQLTRSMGLPDRDALQFNGLEPLPTPAPPVEPLPEPNPDDPYAGLMKDADKLKLMLLAWNYQNSNAVRNGTDGPDLGVVGGLWAQYQSALNMSAGKAPETSISPVPRTEQSSPMEAQDETNSSGQKDEDEGSEDDSDDKMDTHTHDPERLKAFNMFVRLFVDENLDRIIPISKQPKEKIQAIIDSCARQFPEFSERSRKRIRTYLKSCRRNKKTREGWDNTSRPTPAHLTSVQAEQMLAFACENESMNAKRMRVGLDPISQSLPVPGSSNSAIDTVAPSTTYPGFRTTPNPTTTEPEGLVPASTTSISSARSSPLALNTTAHTDAKVLGAVANNSAATNGHNTSPALYRPTDFTSPSSTSPFAARPSVYPSYFPATLTAGNATPTDLSMKPSSHLPTPTITSSSGLSPATCPPPPLMGHKLSANEVTAARQVINAYRESAAFLLRTADQVEQLLIQQQ